MSVLPAGDTNTTALIQTMASGDRDAAHLLLPIVYEELRGIAGSAFRKWHPSNTLQPTALVHEAFLRLCGESGRVFSSRAHFLAICASMMRGILVDHYRHKQSEKAGGLRIHMDDLGSLGSQTDGVDLVLLDEALARLATLDARYARVVELRFFGGLTEAEVAEVLGVTERTVDRDWRFAKGWLRRELSEGDSYE